ncbi:uncharacterized protein LOC124163094 isoform X2 [Ischnura elegans]|nr:uncharacterized protein LOC124163094 isoform X2 [Ischnura elegans]
MNEIMVARAVRTEGSAKNVPLESMIHSTQNYSTKRNFVLPVAQRKLPMNMIVSQTIRRENQMDRESSTNLEPFELVRRPPGSTSANIYPWKTKQKVKNKENIQQYLRPSVADIFQNKYMTMYRSQSLDQIEKYEHMEKHIKTEAVDDRLLEGDEFPYKDREAKSSNLRVSWEDESPMISGIIEETPNAFSQQYQTNTCISPDIMLGETSCVNEKRLFLDARFNELYSQDKQPDHKGVLTENKYLRRSTRAREEDDDNNTSKNFSELSYISQVNDSSEACFLNPFESLVRETTDNRSPENKSRWDKYQPEMRNGDDNSDSDAMSLSGELFGSDIVKFDQGIEGVSKPFNVFEEDPVLNSTDVAEFPLSNSDSQSKLASQHKETGQLPTKVKVKRCVLSELFQEDPEEDDIDYKKSKRICYLSDPDDLLRTPPKMVKQW